MRTIYRIATRAYSVPSNCIRYAIPIHTYQATSCIQKYITSTGRLSCRCIATQPYQPSPLPLALFSTPLPLNATQKQLHSHLLSFLQSRSIYPPSTTYSSYVDLVHWITIPSNINDNESIAYLLFVLEQSAMKSPSIDTLYHRLIPHYSSLSLASQCALLPTMCRIDKKQYDAIYPTLKDHIPSEMHTFLHPEQASSKRTDSTTSDLLSLLSTSTRITEAKLVTMLLSFLHHRKIAAPSFASNQSLLIWACTSSSFKTTDFEALAYVVSSMIKVSNTMSNHSSSFVEDIAPVFDLLYPKLDSFPDIIRLILLHLSNYFIPTSSTYSALVQDCISSLPTMPKEHVRILLRSPMISTLSRAACMELECRIKLLLSSIPTVDITLPMLHHIPIVIRQATHKLDDLYTLVLSPSYAPIHDMNELISCFGWVNMSIMKRYPSYRASIIRLIDSLLYPRLTLNIIDTLTDDSIRTIRRIVKFHPSPTISALLPVNTAKPESKSTVPHFRTMVSYHRIKRALTAHHFNLGTNAPWLSEVKKKKKRKKNVKSIMKRSIVKESSPPKPTGEKQDSALQYLLAPSNFQKAATPIPNVSGHVASMSTDRVVEIYHWCEKHMYRHEELLNEMANTMLSRLSTLDNKDIVTILSTHAELNVRHDALFNAICNELMTHIDSMDVRDRVSTVRAYVILGYESTLPIIDLIVRLFPDGPSELSNQAWCIVVALRQRYHTLQLEQQSNTPPLSETSAHQLALLDAWFSHDTLPFYIPSSHPTYSNKLTRHHSSGPEAALYAALQACGYKFIMEYFDVITGFAIDAVILEPISDQYPSHAPIAIEMEGPYHYTLPYPYYMNGWTRFKHRVLRDAGWNVISIPATHTYQDIQLFTPILQQRIDDVLAKPIANPHPYVNPRVDPEPLPSIIADRTRDGTGLQSVRSSRSIRVCERRRYEPVKPVQHSKEQLRMMMGAVRTRARNGIAKKQIRFKRTSKQRPVRPAKLSSTSEEASLRTSRTKEDIPTPLAFDSVKENRTTTNPRTE